MLYWLEEQLIIFLESSAKYILSIALVIAFTSFSFSSYYWKKFDETPNKEYLQKLEYKVKAKTSKKISIIVFIAGIVLSYAAYQRKKRFYDSY